MADKVPRYFITRDDGPEKEVSKDEFVRAERDAGFHNTMGQPHEPATAGFSSSRGPEEISGRISYS